jgi:hypothetical protein
MDWAKINDLLEIVHKAAGVPEANHIRNEAIAALRVINDGAAPKAAVAVESEPELPLTTRRV